MNVALALARRHGVQIRFTDLGDWGDAELRSEYDPSVPEIRINVRCIEGLSQSEYERLVALAVGHELYHHREAIGAVSTLPARKAREAAADRFAHSVVQGS